MIDIATDVDLFEKQTIRITRKTQDFSELTSKESEFSKTFLGPASKKNFEVIDNYGLVNANSTYNPHKGIECIWSVSSSARFQGRLEVRKVIYEGGEPKSIEFVFYGKQRTLANIIGSDRFSEIDWSDYDHLLTYDNVRDSWDGDLLSGDLLYPLVDTFRDYFVGPDTLDIEGNISNENHPILLTDLKPAIRFSSFLETIFTNYGLTLTISSELSDYIEGMYILPNRLSGENTNPETIEDNLSQVDDGTTPEITTTDTGETITFDVITTDPNSQWTSTTYTAALDGTHTLQSGFISVNLDGPNSAFNAGFYDLRVILNGSDVIQTFTTEQGFNAASFFIGIPTTTIELSSGDELTFQLYRRTDGFLVGQNCEVMDAQIQILSPVNELGNSVEFALQMPDEKVVKWLSEKFKSWNLQIIPNDLNPNEYTLSTIGDWYDDGTIVDWSKQANIKNLVYSKRKVYREIIYKYKDSESSTSETFKDVTGGRAFGELRIRPDVEFGEAQLKIENPCNLVIPSALLKVDENGIITNEQANLVIHKSLNTEGSPVSEPWLLFYFNGRVSTFDSYYLQDSLVDGVPVGELQTEYPYISSGQDAFSLPTTRTLSFSLENPLLGFIPNETAYKTHWQDTVITQYDTLSRTLEGVELFLTTEQFVNYKLNDEIFIEGNYWRISEIRHDTSKGDKAIATLQSSRTNNSPKAYTITPGGKINFTGTPDPLDLTTTGSISIGSDYYVGAPLIKIKPNLNSYLLAKANISVQIIKEINEIGGRFRSWSEDES